MLKFHFFYIPILFIAWVLSFPREAIALIENLKQRLACFMLQQLITKDMHLLKTRFRKWGRLNGYKKRLIDEMFDQHTKQIAQRLETRYSQLNIDEWFQ